MVSDVELRVNQRFHLDAGVFRTPMMQRKRERERERERVGGRGAEAADLLGFVALAGRVDEDRVDREHRHYCQHLQYSSQFKNNYLAEL